MKEEPKRATDSKTILVSSAIFALILCFVILYRDEILKSLQETDSFWLMLGGMSYLCNYLTRACRLWELTGRIAPYFPGFVKIAGIHGFCSYFFPLRSGDLSLPFLLKSDFNLDLLKGGGILFKARLLDIYSVGFYLLAATFFTPTLLGAREKYLFYLVGFCFVLFPFLMIFVLRKPGIIKLPNWLEKVECEKSSNYPGIKETLISLVIWFWTGCTLFCVIKAVQVPLSFFDVWFVTAVQIPLQLLPIQGFANAGGHEASWLVALSILGITVNNGLAIALTTHVIIIFYVLLLGAIAVLLPSSENRQRRFNLLQ